MHKMESKGVPINVLFALNFKKHVKIQTHQTHCRVGTDAKMYELMKERKTLSKYQCYLA